MQSHELLREVFKDTSAKQIAADLNLSLSMIYKWAEPPEKVDGSGLANPLDRMEQLIKSTHDPRLPQWICERAGGFCRGHPWRHRQRLSRPQEPGPEPRSRMRARSVGGRQPRKSIA